MKKSRYFRILLVYFFLMVVLILLNSLLKSEPWNMILELMMGVIAVPTYFITLWYLYAKPLNVEVKKNTLKPKKVNIEFRAAVFTEEYKNEWGIYHNDYFQIYVLGDLLSPTLYRKGGFGGKWVDGYMQLLKCTESRSKNGQNNGYLSNHNCIIDVNGKEKYYSGSVLESVYLRPGGIYVHSSKYFNVRNNLLYCESYTYMVTKDYTFLDNKYDKDESRRGVMKISHLDGSYEIIQ